MSKELEAYFKIDNTLCLNSQNIKLGMDVDEHIDCQNVDELADCLETIKKALEEHEAIDNTEPSEALECLENIEADLTGLPKHVTEYDDGFDNYLEDIWGNVDTIKQALLKEQENARSEEILQKYYQEGITLDSVRALKQERDNYKKVLEIIKEKRVNFDLFWNHFVDNGFGYHYYLEKWYKYQSTDKQKLTEEEFSLLKEILE